MRYYILYPGNTEADYSIEEFLDKIKKLKVQIQD